MLVQPPDHRQNDVNLHHNHETGTASSGGPMIKINVAHASAQHELFIPAHSTVELKIILMARELKKQIAEKTGLEPYKQRVLFRGKEREDNVKLNSAGMKDKSKVLVLGIPASKVNKVEETTNSKEKVEDVTTSKDDMVEKIEETEEMSKAFAAVAGIRKEINKLSERVARLEVAVNSVTNIAAEEFDLSAELLMRELLKLDGNEAEGEAKLQRKAEVGTVGIEVY